MKLTPIAFLEPTFVGEIVLTGTILVVGVIYIYEMSEYMDKAQEEEKEHCAQMYALCINRFSNNNLPCSDCINKCTSQSFWPFELCPFN